MSVITLQVDEVMRTLSNDGQYPFVKNDKTVDIVRFALNTGFTDVTLDDNSALRVMYQRPGETEVRAQTLTYYDTDGLRNYYDWQLLSADLAEKGALTVALCILRTDTEVEEWHTTPYQIRVLDSIHTDDSDEADETITPTVAQRVALLESMIQRVASGAPVVVSSVSEMVDTDRIYVLTTDGKWYYHNGSAWVAGGEYGAVATDTTLTQPGAPADAKAAGDAINEVKADLVEQADELKSVFPLKPHNTVFFDGANYFDPITAEYIDGGLAINASGAIFSASANAKSLVVPVNPNTEYTLYIPDGNRQYVGEKETNDFASGQAITMLVTENADYPCTFTTGETTNYIFVYFNSGPYDYDAKKNQIKMHKGDVINNGYPTLNNNYLGMIPEEKLDIFRGMNLFNDADTIYRTDRNINQSTGVVFTSSIAKSITFPVEPSTRYSIFVPDGNRSLVAEGTDLTFAINSTKTVLVPNATLTYPIEFTTSATAKYVFVVISVGEYDYESKKAGIKLFKGKYWNRPNPYLPIGIMDEEINNLYGLNLLIFGDSITDCCNITVNSSDETTAYSWKNPSNSYTDAGGNAIAYSMWPKILKETQPLGEIRNYALSGASVKSETRESGSERLNLQYQIDLAINDLNNPNNVFSVDRFVPDIVIFAIGTNDVAPNDTYDSAMDVVTYLSDGVSVDVDATMAQLDPTKFCQSARLAFLKIKKLFPMAQIYYYLPLQRARYQQNTTSLHTELEKMAKRYGCIIIDGTFESGIIAEFEQVGHLGALLKDGLHPNEKGQNLMVRQILASIKSHFMPFEFGFNK